MRTSLCFGLFVCSLLFAGSGCGPREEITGSGLQIPAEAPSAEGTRTGPNLLADPSIEELDARGRPREWIPNGKPVVSNDPGKAHTGKIAVLGADSYFIQTVPVQAGHTYLIGHFSRSDRQANYGRLQVNFSNELNTITQSMIDVALAPQVWTWNQRLYTAPEGVTRATIFLQPHETGEVWFDDIWFGEATPGAEKAGTATTSS